MSTMSVQLLSQCRDVTCKGRRFPLGSRRWHKVTVEASWIFSLQTLGDCRYLAGNTLNHLTSMRSWRPLGVGGDSHVDECAEFWRHWTPPNY